MSVTSSDKTVPAGLQPFNPANPDLLIDPYPVYTEYRTKDPVHWGIATNPVLPGSWYVFRHEDTAAVLADPRLKSNPESVGMAHAIPPAFEPVAHVFLEWLGALDHPEHSRIRSVMAKAFTPRRVNQLKPRIEAIANQLIDDLVARGEPFDLVTSYAFPIPMVVIGDMLGVPSEGREMFRELSTDFAKAVDNPGDEVAAKAGSAAALQMLDYFKEQVEIRRREPVDDLLNAMMVASNDEGQVMTEFEVLATAIELIVAGHETTVNTVTKATHLMLGNGAYRELAERPERLTESAVEELLRWTSPLQRQRNRWVTEPMELGGKQLEVGDAVVALLGAANHDPEQFPDPERLDFDRPVKRHMTFGHGPHFCLGASLARLEVGTAVRALVTRAPDLQLASPDIEWRKSTLIPGPASLLVRA